MDYGKNKEGKAKNFSENILLSSMHAQHVEKGGCGDEDIIFSQWHTGYN